MARRNRPQTPDGRYLVSRGVLKRCTNPDLEGSVRRAAVKAMMQARMSGDKQAVHAAKQVLGESGPVWWTDGAPDYSNHSPMDTPYKQWWDDLSAQAREAALLDSRLKSS